ncbi:MAG: Asp23/Gls24 family envelope stress response protein [Oscillospiraceae bacterium]|nr:Asp23/Gls24 family envelope stress response protein [Oscillospiraceae bacterium]
MIRYRNPLGTIKLTEDYFAGVVSAAAKSCFGVAAMSTRGAGDDMRSLVLGKNFPEKGVRVTEEDGMLAIELHIKVTYGLNIAAAVKSISHKVKYAVEEATGLKVRHIDVSVDDIV